MVKRVVLIEGDGIGREVIPAAAEVVRATGVQVEFVSAEAGWECFQRSGTALPVETLALVRESDAALFGAVSSPLHRVEGYRSPIVALRRALDLYANLRPVFSMPIPASRQGIDLLVVRENSEGLYSGRERREGDTVIAERVISRKGSERIVRVACEQAMSRHRHLTVVHKANVLRESDGLFREVAFEVARSYPDLAVEEMLVDTAALRLVTEPERFDVLVTTNLFGDILSDEAAGLVGGLGLAPSANVGEKHGVFEPVHGSAPDIAGKGIANPSAAILAAGMMLEYLGEAQAAQKVRQAVLATLRDGPRTPDLGGSAATEDVSRAVIGRMSA
ncbi:MAG: isocitrate/isopropylmalate dehydrogenase family protein [Anaerolineae bacterium]|nr:isocitrate/isopropylmalate dehydrogenase family protein [Anaerolineae bacterium]